MVNFSDPEKQNKLLLPSNSLDQSKFASRNANLFSNNTLDPHPDHVSVNLGMNDVQKFNKNNAGNRIVGNIQNRIYQAIKQSQDTKPQDIPQSFGKIDPIKEAKEIQPSQAKVYQPQNISTIDRNPNLFKGESYRVQPSILKSENYNHRSKFNLRYNKPNSIVQEEMFSLNDDSKGQDQSIQKAISNSNLAQKLIDNIPKPQHALSPEPQRSYTNLVNNQNSLKYNFNNMKLFGENQNNLVFSYDGIK